MLLYVIRDALVFGFLGIVFGFLLDFLFPDPDRNENLIQALVLVFLQILVCSIIIYYLSRAFEHVAGYDADQYLGITMFSVLFFLVQVQLFDRISILFNNVTGKHLPNGF